MKTQSLTVNEFCKFFRKYILNLTLKEFEEKTNVKTPTISSFENGRSTNLNHLYLYYNLADEEQKIYFRKNIPYNFKG